MLQNSIRIGAKSLWCSLSSVACDIPARAFIPKVKGSTCYFSCAHCIRRGPYRDNCVTLPYIRYKIPDGWTAYEDWRCSLSAGHSIWPRWSGQAWARFKCNEQFQRNGESSVSFIRILSPCTEALWVRGPRHHGAQNANCDHWRTTSQWNLFGTGIKRASSTHRFVGAITD